MTIKEAKETPKNCEANSGSDAYNKGIKKANTMWKHRIDKIYGDFESRTCESCKHSSVAEDTYSGTIVSMFCAEGVGEFEVCDVMQSTPDFGCNKWEGKDDI